MKTPSIELCSHADSGSPTFPPRMNTFQKHPVLSGAVAGLIFVLVQWRLAFWFGAVGAVMDILNTPASWAFDKWYRAGLPPRGDAAVAGSFAAVLIQWVCLGCLLALLFARQRQKAPNLSVHNETIGNNPQKDQPEP
jgi:hypothetical protein